MTHTLTHTVTHTKTRGTEREKVGQRERETVRRTHTQTQEARVGREKHPHVAKSSLFNLRNTDNTYKERRTDKHTDRNGHKGFLGFRVYILRLRSDEQ